MFDGKKLSLALLDMKEALFSSKLAYFVSYDWIRFANAAASWERSCVNFFLDSGFAVSFEDCSLMSKSSFASLKMGSAS